MLYFDLILSYQSQQTIMALMLRWSPLENSSLLMSSITPIIMVPVPVSQQPCQQCYQRIFSLLHITIVIFIFTTKTLFNSNFFKPLKWYFEICCELSSEWIYNQSSITFLQTSITMQITMYLQTIHELNLWPIWNNCIFRNYL